MCGNLPLILCTLYFIGSMGAMDEWEDPRDGDTVVVPYLSTMASPWPLTVRICSTNRERQRLIHYIVLRGDMLNHTRQIIAKTLHVVILWLADDTRRVNTGQTS